MTLSIRWIRHREVRTVGPDDLAHALAGDGYVWIDLADPTAEEVRVLHAPELAIDPLVIEDVCEDRHLPKLDVLEDHVLLVVHAIDAARSSVALATVELDCVLGHGWLLTHHKAPIGAIRRAGRVLDGGADHPADAVRLLHRILDDLNDVFLPFLNLLEGRIEAVEEDVLDRPTEDTRSEIFALRRDLLGLRRFAVPQAEAVSQLGRSLSPLIEDEHRRLFDDVHDHLYRLAEVAETSRHLVDGAYDLYRAARDDEQSRRLALLTMVSTLLLPITVLSSIYGMNFEYMPELDEAWAYPTLLGVFVLILTTGVVLFARWGWLRPRRATEDNPPVRRTMDVPEDEDAPAVPAYGRRVRTRPLEEEAKVVKP